MAKKTYMKRCSKSPVIRVMELRPQLDIIKIPRQVYMRLREQAALVPCFCKCKLVQPLWKKYDDSSKLKTELPYHPEIPLLDQLVNDLPLPFALHS